MQTHGQPDETDVIDALVPAQLPCEFLSPDGSVAGGVRKTYASIHRSAQPPAALLMNARTAASTDPRQDSGERLCEVASSFFFPMRTQTLTHTSSRLPGVLS